MDYRSSNRKLAGMAAAGAVSAALVMAGVAGTRAGAQAPEPQWRALPDGGPGYGWAAVTDATRDRVVFHGGETNEGSAPDPAPMLRLDPVAWGEWLVEGDVPRSSRSGRGLLGSPAVADGTGGTLLAVCDCLSAGTYEMDLASDRWSAIDSDVVRHLDSPNLVYDGVADRAIVFGGREYGITDILTATYAYDLSAARRGWSPLPSVPFQLQNQAVAVDPRTAHVVAVGGQDNGGEPSSELWRIDLARADETGAWERIEPVGAAPPARIGASLTFVGEGQAVLYGGYADARHLGDVWFLDYGDPAAPAWSELRTSADGPPPRAAHAAVWDSRGERLIVSGGITGDDWALTVLDDAWALYMDNAPLASPTPTVGTPAPTSGTPTATGTPGGAGGVFLPTALRRAEIP